jgi:hypothetical protein
MATLRQDVWFGENPRLSGLRLGPFRNAAARVLLHPHRSPGGANPALDDFIDRLADRVEVVLLHPRPVDDAALVVAQWRGDLVRVIERIEQTWSSRLPLVLAGVGLGGALALSLAGHAALSAAAALAPFVPSRTPWPSTADAGDTFDPPALARPVLIVAPREEQRLDLPRLEAAVSRWEQATWIAPPGSAAAALAPVWAAALAEWVLAAARD